MKINHILIGPPEEERETEAVLFQTTDDGFSLKASLSSARYTLYERVLHFSEL